MSTPVDEPPGLLLRRAWCMAGVVMGLLGGSAAAAEAARRFDGQRLDGGEALAMGLVGVAVGAVVSGLHLWGLVRLRTAPPDQG